MKDQKTWECIFCKKNGRVLESDRVHPYYSFNRKVCFRGDNIPGGSVGCGAVICHECRVKVSTVRALGILRDAHKHCNCESIKSIDLV